MKRLSQRSLVLVLLIAVAIFAGACGSAPAEDLTSVKLLLDWVPNTNHTGIFVAQEKGYFEDAGLEVQIIQPGEVYAEQAVAGGAADFGISFQESVCLARAEGAPIVSVAAVVQHNTSGFASLASTGVDDPADFEGLRYGGWGSPYEAPTLRALMECSGADFSSLDMVTTGFSDPIAMLSEGQVDLVWIFYGWQGIQAELQGIDLDIVMMKDYLDCVPDYYTPVVIASESKLVEEPEVVSAMLEALSRGYEFAAEDPDGAADILLEAAPELDAGLVRTSQRWISAYYIAEASQWGEQKMSIWQEYVGWMVEEGIVGDPIAVEDAFTEDFLPR